MVLNRLPGETSVTVAGKDDAEIAEIVADLRTSASRDGFVRVSNSGIDSPAAFDRVARLLGASTRPFSEESSPRTALTDLVWSSTDYPSRYPIQFHNEFSYASEWPQLVAFCCLVPPSAGGATPIVDVRRMLERLRPSTRDEFTCRGLLYERNFSPGSGVSWQRAFGTGDPQLVEEHCRRAGIDLEWREGGLTTRQTAAAIVNHPLSGEPVWFNHALLFNVAGVEPSWLRDFFSRQDPSARAFNSYFEDGEEIPLERLDEIRFAYAAERDSAPWSAGDLLVIDNMLTAHGRDAFSGPRQIVVSLIGRWTREDLRGSGRKAGSDL